jgi:hypothetical protein
VAGAVLTQLWPGVPPAHRVTVLLYVLCLSSIAALSAVTCGALLVASDALLATNKYAGPLPLAALLVLSNYWAEQWFVVGPLRERAATTFP